MRVVVNKKLFDKVLEVMKNVRVETVFVVDAENNKLRVEAINYAKTALIRAKIDVLEADENFTLAVDSSKIHNAIKAMSSPIAITKKNGEIEISGGSIVYRIAEFVGDYVKVPSEANFEVTTEIKMLGSDMKRLIELAKKFGDIMFCGDSAIIKGDIDSVRYEFTEYKGDAKSCYSAEILEAIKPALGNDDAVLIRYGDGKPAIIQITGDGYEIEYIVAPRVMAVD